MAKYYADNGSIRVSFYSNGAIEVNFNQFIIDELDWSDDYVLKGDFNKYIEVCHEYGL